MNNTEPRPSDSRPVAFDVEKSLRICVPFLFELLGSNNISKRDWKKINKKVKNHADEKKKQFFANNNYLKFETNLYDIIIGATIGGDKPAQIMLIFINTIFFKLTKCLPTEKTALLRDTIYNMLTQFDKDYRNYFAELAVLSMLLENSFTLVRVEKDTISGEKTADFTVEKDGEITLVEIVSIHFYEPMENIAEFIYGKLTDKIRLKTNNECSHNQFHIMPVLWAFPNDLLKYHQLYKAGRVRLPDNVHEPFAYVPFYDENLDFDNRFLRISYLFTGDKIEIVKS